MKNINGEQVSLNDFKGKVLYVDIWASWCGPCRKQFPYSKKLKTQLSKRQLKKIEFIYISIDNDSEKWKKSINDLDVDGLHFLSPASHPNGAGVYFEAFSIPRYILIDRNGIIIHHNAKRPSDPKLIDDLLHLIK